MLLSGKNKYNKYNVNDGKSQLEKSSDINLPTLPALDIKDVAEMPAERPEKAELCEKATMPF